MREIIQLAEVNLLHNELIIEVYTIKVHPNKGTGNKLKKVKIGTARFHTKSFKVKFKPNRARYKDLRNQVKKATYKKYSLRVRCNPNLSGQLPKGKRKVCR